jgi:hypothetical protein
MSLRLRRRTFVIQHEELPHAFSHHYIEIENILGTVRRYAVRKFGDDWFMVESLCEDFDDGGVRVYEATTFERFSSNFTRVLNLHNYGYETYRRIYSGFCMNYDYYNSGRRLFPEWLSVPTSSDISNLISILGTSSENWFKPTGFNFYEYSTTDWHPSIPGANLRSTMWVNTSDLPTGTNSEQVIRFFGVASSAGTSFGYVYMQVGRGVNLRLKVTDESKVKYSEAYVPQPNW